MKSNSRDLETKWLRYGFDKAIYELHPQFAYFLLETPLGSQMKITGDKPFMLGDEPAILVDERPCPYSELIQKFTCSTCDATGEKILIQRESGQTYTYLGGLGLSAHDPYKSFFKKPLMSLSDDEMKTIKEGAALFGRAGDHVLQIVSCAMPRPSGFSRRHVYLRLITDQGLVYSFGFHYKKPFSLLYQNHVGLLRSPDIWEYHNRCQKTVTSLLITEDEKARLKSYIEGHFSSEKRPVFNLLSQNCALFVREAIRYCCGIKLPTKNLILSDTFSKVTARWEALVKFFFPNRSLFFKPFLKMIHELVRSSIEVSLSLILSLIGLILGAAFGVKGRRLANPDVNEEIVPPAKRLDWWLDLYAKEIHFPKILEKWQRRQSSTRIFESALQLAL